MTSRHTEEHFRGPEMGACRVCARNKEASVVGPGVYKERGGQCGGAGWARGRVREAEGGTGLHGGLGTE